MVLLIIILLFLTGVFQDEYLILRNQMVDNQLVNRGIYDDATLTAMRQVPRHLFVPPENQRYAYDDRPLMIGYGQTISQPYIVAYMTEALHLDRSDTVLEIGTGSGYQAAVLAEIAAMIYTVEIVKPLGIHARDRLKMLGYNNIQVIIGDGYYGLKAHAPFDAIIVTAAPKSIPPELIRQLKEGGKLIIPVGGEFEVQYLILVEKKKDKLITQKLVPVRFVPFTRSF